MKTDFLFVDPARRMDPDYIREWWLAFENREKFAAEIGIKLPVPPWNAPGWDIEDEGPEASEGVPESVSPSRKMDDAQTRVVLHPNGPALVMAGAGSGKTRTITARVVHLLERGVEAKNILCLTFTRKAANEMRERIQREAGDVSKHTTISTFHSLALDLLRTHPETCGRNKNFSVWNDDVQKSEIKAIIKAHPNASHAEQREWITPSQVCEVLDNLKEKGLPIPGKQFHLAMGELDEQAWEIAIAYEEMKKSCNALDFADLVWHAALHLLGPDSAKKALVQGRWTHVIVDEYQDTNAIQETFLQRLVEPHQNLMVVGDEDQAIYSFRGSNVGFIRTFPKRYPGAVTYLLGRNYRSTPQIVESANALISQNKQRNYKKVWSEAIEGQQIRVGSWADPNAEARAVTSEIAQVREDGVPDTDIAVLVRTRMQFIPIQMELQRRGIPFHVVGDVPWYARADAKTILAWLRGVLNPLDHDAGANILKSWDGLGSGTVALWREAMATIGEPMFSRMSMLHGKPGLGVHTKRGKRIATFIETWKEWEIEAYSGEKGLRTRIQELLKHLGITDQILEGKSSEKTSDVIDASRRESFLQHLLNSMPDEPQTGRWQGIQQWVDELFTAEVQAENKDGICLSTIHGSKGLEWDCVWLPGWSSGVFPSERAGNATAIEEERRLAYVAATRARKHLCISWYRYSTIPTPRTHTPSSFLAEMDPTQARGEEWTKVVELDPAPASPEKMQESRVRHEIAGHVEPWWCADTVGELQNPIQDEDQSENMWFGWYESGQFMMRSVVIHDEEDPIRCIACGRSVRVSVSFFTQGEGLPPMLRLGRRCAARLIGFRGKILDATKVAERIGIQVINEKSSEPKLFKEKAGKK
jgi:DNA helicase-2/ATP-dependent DNA helicase PcrA